MSPKLIGMEIPANSRISRESLEAMVDAERPVGSALTSLSLVRMGSVFFCLVCDCPVFTLVESLERYDCMMISMRYVTRPACSLRFYKVRRRF